MREWETIKFQRLGHLVVYSQEMTFHWYAVDCLFFQFLCVNGIPLCLVTMYGQKQFLHQDTNLSPSEKFVVDHYIQVVVDHYIQVVVDHYIQRIWGGNVDILLKDNFPTIWENYFYNSILVKKWSLYDLPVKS